MLKDARWCKHQEDWEKHEGIGSDFDDPSSTRCSFLLLQPFFNISAHVKKTGISVRVLQKVRREDSTNHQEEPMRVLDGKHYELLCKREI